jgi:hypothetical protein
MTYIEIAKNHIHLIKDAEDNSRDIDIKLFIVAYGITAICNALFAIAEAIDRK